MPTVSAGGAAAIVSRVPRFFGVSNRSARGVAPHVPYWLVQLVVPPVNHEKCSPPWRNQSARYC
jgi:hypothetical protein